jgi:cytochrome c biogenesis factor
VHRDWLHAQDLFVTVDRITEDGTFQVVVLVNQMLPLLWLGGLITIVGALIVAVPGRRRTRPVTTDSTIPVRDDGNLPIRTGVGG